MTSENYRTLLNNEYKNQELSADDFDNTLMHFAKLYHAEQLRLGAVVGRSEQLSNEVLENAIAKAKPNMDKINDVDEWLDSIR
jgi:hypothetical protein